VVVAGVTPSTSKAAAVAVATAEATVAAADVAVAAAGMAVAASPVAVATTAPTTAHAPLLHAASLHWSWGFALFLQRLLGFRTCCCNCEQQEKCSFDGKKSVLTKAAL
jgi:hypothetical protein